MDWGHSDFRRLAVNSEWLVAWLTDAALPFWDTRGVDRHGGGFFEEISHSGQVRNSALRRGRVVARQIYVFSVGNALGWKSAHSDPAEHGCDYLLNCMRDADGRFHTAVSPSDLVPRGPFSLYEYAFYLFALAHVCECPRASSGVAAANAGLSRLRAEFQHPKGGFEESSPPSLPLKSNPHMHLLEAAIAWEAASEGEARQPWRMLAQEIVTLCLSRFIQPASDAVHEYFDADWQPLRGDPGRIVEPGHQFEWGWLLLTWAHGVEGAEGLAETCRATGRKLIEIGERGVDSTRNVAVNELWDDLQVKDPAAKLWPQTERLKAWCALIEDAKSQTDLDRACRGANAAAAGLRQYLLSEPRGLWHEVLDSDGHFSPGASKASSFYHIVCAIDTLRKTVNDCRNASRSERDMAVLSSEESTPA